MKGDELTIRDIEALTGATAMTIYNWRQGRTDKSPLPWVEVPTTGGLKPRVRFKRAAFVKWARKNNIDLDKRAAKRLGVTLSAGHVIKGVQLLSSSQRTKVAALLRART